jgi:hypothetical protein
MPHGNYSFLFELHRIGFVIWSRILLITKTPILSFTCFAANKLFLVCPKNNLVSLKRGRIIGTFAYFPTWLFCTFFGEDSVHFFSEHGLAVALPASSRFFIQWKEAGGRNEREAGVHFSLRLLRQRSSWHGETVVRP